MAEERTAAQRNASRNATPKVNWDASNMKTSYANVCNVTSTREEVVVMFGIGQTISSPGDEVSVALNERVILSPFAAKRLALLLDNVLKQYEERFGSLDVPSTTPHPTASAN